MMNTRLAVLLFALTTLIDVTIAHGDHAAHEPQPGEREASYAELHMASEHHLDNFDIQSFFHLHDLNRDGVLDVNELESVYGVHHEKARKESGSVEVHTEKAKEIVSTVLKKLDSNGDGVLTMREFVAGGVDGLPNFKDVPHLGHHYDAEGEYFLHHEELYHSTPETQHEGDYIHQEDLDHFMDHAHIDEVEEERVREFTGEDSIPHHHAADAASPAVPVARDYLAESIAAQQKILAAPAVPVRASREESARIERATLARAQAAKFGKEAREARLRGEWIDEDFGVPRDAADRLRKAVPYKFKVRKNWWGEF